MYKLRELQRVDIPIINSWRKNSELIDLLCAPYRYINLDVDYTWYETYLNNRNNTIRCAIIEESEDSILGLVSLTNINFINQCGELHIMIGDKKNRGRGIGQFAILEMLRHAFNNININRIELNVLEGNTRAINLYENIGFKREGLKRKSVYKNGQFIDSIMMGIIKEDFIK